MKTKKIIALSLIVIGLSFCKTAKKAESDTSTTVVSPELQKAAETRYPGIAVADIAEGQKLYIGKCGKCHDLPKVISEKEEKWPKIMDWMAPKSNMDQAQKEKTLKYILSARDIAEKK